MDLIQGIWPGLVRRGLVVKAAGWLSLDRQFESYPRANTVAPSWCGLGCRSRTLMVEYISPWFIWRPWLGLEKRDFKFTGTGASTSVPSGYNIINFFFVLEMLRRLASAAADATFS
jgi:hypothetical protein